MSDSLRGKLLIASPSLYDYFRRAVVLVLEHTGDGAMGVILNRVSETPVADAVPALADLTDGHELVRLGGPVALESVVVLGDFEDPSEASTSVFDSVGVVDPDGPPPALRRMRVFAGHAGWAPGQLEAEIERHDWTSKRAEMEAIFSGKSERPWPSPQDPRQRI